MKYLDFQLAIKSVFALLESSYFRILNIINDEISRPPQKINKFNVTITSRFFFSLSYVEFYIKKSIKRFFKEKIMQYASFDVLKFLDKCNSSMYTLLAHRD